MKQEYLWPGAQFLDESKGEQSGGSGVLQGAMRVGYGDTPVLRKRAKLKSQGERLDYGGKVRRA